MKVEKINLVWLSGAPSLDSLFVELQPKAVEKNLVNEFLQIAHWTRLRSIEPTQFSRELCGTLRYYSKGRDCKTVG